MSLNHTRTEAAPTTRLRQCDFNPLSFGMNFGAIACEFFAQNAQEYEDSCTDDVLLFLGLDLVAFSQAQQRRLVLGVTCRLPGQFTLSEWSLNHHGSFFRFKGDDITLLQVVLGIPEDVVLPNRGVVPGIEVTCLMLRRMTFPARWIDIQAMFRRDVGTLSRMFLWAVRFLCLKFGPLLYWDDNRLSKHQLLAYSHSVLARGSRLANVWGFIDGTFVRCCRPTEGKSCRMHVHAWCTSGQRSVYNGWKRAHGWKFQAVQAPDGIIAHLAGPYEGHRNDTGIFTRSLLGALVEARMREWGIHLVMYGDAGYLGRSDVFVAPHSTVGITPQQEMENMNMSRVRVCVEHAFGKVCNLWHYMMCYRQLKTMKQPVGRFYQLAVLLTNCHTCMYGSQTGRAFRCEPPDLCTYLRTAQMEGEPLES